MLLSASIIEGKSKITGIGHAPKDFDYKKELEDRFIFEQNSGGKRRRKQIEDKQYAKPFKQIV